MAELLEASKTIVLNINSVAEDLATLEVLPNNREAKSRAKKALTEAQIDLAKLLNKITN